MEQCIKTSHLELIHNLLLPKGSHFSLPLAAHPACLVGSGQLHPPTAFDGHPTITESTQHPSGGELSTVNWSCIFINGLFHTVPSLHYLCSVGSSFSPPSVSQASQRLSWVWGFCCCRLWYWLKLLYQCPGLKMRSEVLHGMFVCCYPWAGLQIIFVYPHLRQCSSPSLPCPEVGCSCYLFLPGCRRKAVFSAGLVYFCWFIIYLYGNFIFFPICVHRWASMCIPTL